MQHYEYQPTREAAPVFTLEPADGIWYQHFVAEAERLWEAGTEWPLSPDAAVARAHRPVFREQFGPEFDLALDNATDLLITGVARNSLVNSRYRWLEKKLAAGDRLRFLLIDPDNAVIETAAQRYHTVRTPESVRDRLTQTLRLLAKLKTATDGDLVVRVTVDPQTRCWVLESDGNWAASPADGSSVRDHQAQMLQAHRAVG